MNVGLPGQGLLQGYKTGVEGSPEAAAAPWAALGEVGREVSELGGKAMDTLVRLQREDNRRLASEAMLRAEEFSSGFELKMRENDDPALWREEWPKERDAFLKTELEAKKLAPEQREAISEGLTAWSSRSTLRVREIGTIAGIQRGRVATDRLLAKAAETGNVELGKQVIAGLGLPAEATAQAVAALEGEVELKEMTERAKSDPQVLLADLAEKDADGLDLHYTRTTAQQKRQVVAVARDTVEVKRGEEHDGLVAKYEGHRMTPGDIEGAGYLTEADRAAWGMQLGERAVPTVKERTEAWRKAGPLWAARHDPKVTPAAYRELFNRTRTELLGLLPLEHFAELGDELEHLSPGRRDVKNLRPGGKVPEVELGARAWRLIDAGLQAGEMDEVQAEEILRSTREFIGMEKGADVGRVSAFVQTRMGALRQELARVEMRDYPPGSVFSVRGVRMPGDWRKGKITNY